MKLADIKAGHVYGYSEDSGQRRIYRYSPYLVVSTDLYVIDRFRDRKLVKAGPEYTNLSRGRRSIHNVVGILAVYLTDHGLGRLDLVRELATPEAAVAGINGEEYAGRDIILPHDPTVLGQYRLLTNQRYLHGDYGTLVAGLAEHDRQRKQMAREREEARLANRTTYRGLEARLSALGVTGYDVSDWESPSRFEGLKFEDMDTLLDLAESAVRANKAAGIGG